MTRLGKIVSIAIGTFMLTGGLNKFREPYITMFHKLVALSGLPFPTLSIWAGELGKIPWDNTPALTTR